MVIGGGGVIAAIKNKKCMRIFKEAGAVGKGNARKLEALGLTNTVVISRLVKLNSLAVSEEGYYVTEKCADSKWFAGL